MGQQLNIESDRAYAAATAQPLLFKGDDFPQSDIDSALQP